MPEKNNQDWQSKFWRIFFIALTIFLVVSAVFPIVKDSCEDFALTSVPEPSSGYMFDAVYYKERVASFEVKSSTSNGYYIILTDAQGSRTKFVFYLQGGDTVEIKVPLGTYEIFYATGETWYGEEDLFGSQTVYRKMEKQYSFYEHEDGGIVGWTMEIKYTSSGELNGELINEEEFPK